MCWTFDLIHLPTIFDIFVFFSHETGHPSGWMMVGYHRIKGDSGDVSSGKLSSGILCKLLKRPRPTFVTKSLYIYIYIYIHIFMDISI